MNLCFEMVLTVSIIIISCLQCPPCRVFTPALVRTYEKLKASGKKFEVIFVSSDRSEDSFTSFANSMPWLALPFGDSRYQMLKNLYEVEGKKNFKIM